MPLFPKKQEYPQNTVTEIVLANPDLWLEAVKGLIRCEPVGMQSFGIVRADKHVHCYMGGVCVAQISYLRNPLWCWVHVQKADSEYGNEWLNFIFDPVLSPWRDIVKTILNDKKEIVCDGKTYRPGSLDFIKKHGFVVGCDWPANFLVNFIKATRMQREYGSDNFALWRKLKADGINPSLAMMFQSAMSKNLSWGGKEGGHWFLDNGNMTLASPVLFCSGKPFEKNLSDSTVEKGGHWNYTPCEQIWSDKKRAWNEGHFTSWQDHIKEFIVGTAKQKKPAFRTTVVTEQEQYTYEQVLAAAKLEQERVEKELNKNDSQAA